MKDLQKYLIDILDTISAIEVIAKDFTISDMDKTANRWALERGISIIGRGGLPSRQDSKKITYY